VQPGRKESLDVAAPARAREPASHLVPLDDHERRHLLDREPLHEVGPFLLRDAVERERAVVPPALEDLRQEALDPATLARERRVEVDEARFDGSLALHQSARPHDVPPSKRSKEGKDQAPTTMTILPAARRFLTP